jgi:hypothetical protein
VAPELPAALHCELAFCAAAVDREQSQTITDPVKLIAP